MVRHPTRKRFELQSWIQLSPYENCHAQRARGKPENEDFLLARRHPGGGDRFICILADGQGGQSNGALAARVACESAWSRAIEASFDTLLAPRAWEAELFAVDQAVCRTGGFTTLIALAVDPDSVAGASSGDSKVFFLGHESGSEIEEWTSRQRKNPPVGSGEAVFASFAANTTGGGRMLIVSDGVWKYCGYEAIRSALQVADLADAPALLKSATPRRSGASLPDDFSVIAVEVE